MNADLRFSAFIRGSIPSEALAVFEGINETLSHLCRHPTTVQHLRPLINSTRIGIAPQETKVMENHKALIPEPHHLITIDSLPKPFALRELSGHPITHGLDWLCFQIFTKPAHRI